MKYKSELIKDIVDTRGHKKSSLHYESECIRAWIEETKGAYPKLCDYESEWLNYINEKPIGKFPYETVTANPTATINNVVPYAYKTAILYGKSVSIDGTLQSVKMRVLTTTGKNLFDGEIEEGVIDNNTGEPQTYRGRSRSKNFIRVPKNTDLYIKLENGVSASWTAIYGYDENKKYLGCIINSSGVDKPFNTGDASYIKWKNNTPMDTLGNIQIEEGSTSTTYEPYQTIILSTPEDLELRGIGDIQDELDCLTGEVTERIKEVVLNGSENWVGRNGATYYAYMINDFFDHPNADGISSHFNFIKGGASSTQSEESICSAATQKSLSLFTNNPQLSTVEQLKSYLASNPIIVQYQLATESIKTVDLSIQDNDGNTLRKIKPIEGTMHITTSGTPINPTASLEVPVEAITQNLSSFIGEE